MLRCPRGSSMSSRRTGSNSASSLLRTAIALASWKSGRPPTTILVGSPWVWDSTVVILGESPSRALSSKDITAALVDA